MFLKLAYYPGNHYDALTAGAKLGNAGDLNTNQELTRPARVSEGTATKSNENEHVGASLATTAGSKRVLSNDGEKGSGR